MSDTDQGQQGDIELFRDAVDTPTLEQFENPKLPEPKPQEAKEPAERTRDEQGRFKQAEIPKEVPNDQEARIPSGRLREESEARRRAEQEILELRARVAAYEVNRQQSQQPQKQPDIFDDPTNFIFRTMAPVLQQMNAESQFKLEKQSTQYAQQMYGVDVVDQAYNAMALSLRSGDATAAAVLQNAKDSHDPYGMITRWYLDRQTLNTVGGDLEAYKKSVLEQAMRDPEYQRQVFNAMRGQATQQINRPVPTVTNQSQSPMFPPSVSDIGAAAGGEELIQDASDDALFRAAVSAKRRPSR